MRCRSRPSAFRPPRPLPPPSRQGSATAPTASSSRCRPAASWATWPGPGALPAGQGAAARPAPDRRAGGRHRRLARVGGTGRGRRPRLRQPLPPPAAASSPSCSRNRREVSPPPARVGDRRAHQHQPQQGGPHRPPAQRRAGRHPGALPAPPRPPGRGPELRRRHRRAGGRRGGRLRCTCPRTELAAVPRVWPRSARRDELARARLAARACPAAGRTTRPRSADFDDLCWDLYPRVTAPLRGRPGVRRAAAPRCSTPSRAAAERPRPRQAAITSLRGAVIAGDETSTPGGGAPRRRGRRGQPALPPHHHGPARRGLRRAAARVGHPPPRLLAARVRAPPGGRRDPPRDRGQERRLLGDVARRLARSSPAWPTPTRSWSAPTAPSPTPARTSPTSCGSSACSPTPTARRHDFGYRPFRPLAAGRAGRRGALRHGGRVLAPHRRPTRPQRPPGATSAPATGSTTSSTCASPTPRRWSGRRSASSATPTPPTRSDPLRLRDGGAHPGRRAAPRGRTAASSFGLSDGGHGQAVRRDVGAARHRRRGRRRCSPPWSTRPSEAIAARLGEGAARPRTLADRARAIAVGALRYLMARQSPQPGAGLRLRRGAGVRGRHRAVPAVLGGARRQDLRQARREARRGGAARPRPPTLAGAEVPDDLWELVLACARRREIVAKAVASLEFSLLAQHVHDLAQLFHKLYRGHRSPGGGRPPAGTAPGGLHRLRPRGPHRARGAARDSGAGRNVTARHRLAVIARSRARRGDVAISNALDTGGDCLGPSGASH